MGITNPATIAYYEGQGRLLEMVARGADLQEILKQLSLLIEAQSPGLYCSVLVLDEDGEHIHPGAGPHMPSTYMAALDGYAIGPTVGSCGTAMFRKETVVVADILEDPLWAPYKFLIADEGFRACWSSPIVSKNSVVLGSFAMYYKEVRHPTGEELNLLEAASHIAGIAIDKQRREDQLQRHYAQLEGVVRQRTEELESALLEQRAIFDNATMAILVAKDRIVQRCNRRMEEMLGYDPDELNGKSTRIYFACEDAWERFGEEAYRQLSSGLAFIGESELMRKDGSRIWVDSHAKAIDPSDLSKGTIWFVLDISARKEAEESRRQLLLEYQATLDNASLGITFTRERKFIHCNDRFGEMFGWHAAELIGKPTLVVYPSPDAFDDLSRLAIPVLASGERLDTELQMKKRDGSLFWCRMLAKAIDANDAGKGSIFITEDITERKLAAEALQQTLLEQQAIFDNANAGIHLVKDRRTVRCNRGLELMLGYGPGELTGKSTRMLYASDDEFERYGAAAYGTINQGQTWIAEVELVRKDGSRVIVSIHSKAMDVDDLSKGTLFVSHDVTARKHAEAALVAAKEDLESSLAAMTQTNRDISLLAELSNFLQSCQSLPEAFECIERFAPQLIPGSAGALYLMEDTSKFLSEQMHWQSIDGASPAFSAVDCWALRRGQPHRVDNPAVEMNCPHLRLEQGLRHAYVCLPLMAQGQAFGLLVIEFGQDAPEGSRRDMLHRLSIALAEHLGLALANIRLRETLRQQSLRDPLTGLYNRRYMNEALRCELARAQRRQGNVALLILDVDHFKKFNDTFGHEAGDRVLESVAKTLEQQLRSGDVVCRLGGEEFVAVLPDVDAEFAGRRAECLLEAMRQLRLNHEGRPLGNVTASIGFAVYPCDAAAPDALLAAADAALYLAKESGRDRVMAHVASNFE